MVEVVGQYTDLKKAGANFSGRCPFHEERTPSFSVNPAEKLYYCFGCGAGGNLIGFVMAKENMDFPEAVEYLADKYGIALEYEESSARGDADRRAPRAPARAARAGDRVLRARPVGRPGGRAGPRVPRGARPLGRGLPRLPRRLQPAGLGEAARRPRSPRGSASRTCWTPGW